MPRRKAQLLTVAKPGNLRIRTKLTRAELDGILLQVNTECIAWLAHAAAKNLDESVKAHGRPQRYNNQRIGKDVATVSLRKTIVRPDSHLVDAKRGKFMVDALVKHRSPHYWVQEVGYEGFKGMLAPILFRGGNRLQRPDEARSPRDQVLRGKGKAYGVYIKNEIKGYHYAERAEQQFQAEAIYHQRLWRQVKHLRDRGVQITVSGQGTIS